MIALDHSFLDGVEELNAVIDSFTLVALHSF